MAPDMVKNNFKIIILILIILIMVIPKNEFAKEENVNEGKIRLGDVNNDQKIDSMDLLWILRHIYASENNKNKEWILTNNKFLAGDITQNGRIDSSDTLAILRYFAASENKEIAQKHENWLKMGEIIIDNTISLNKSNIDLYIGDTELLTVTNAKDRIITWTSSDENIAMVDKEGKVTAKAEGKATITAKTPTGETAECIVTVKVKEISATSIKLNKTSMELQVGKEEKLLATIEPTNTTNKAVTWTTSNEKIAIVDKEGKVTAKAEGEATITAKTINGKTANCIVKVKPNEIYATNIILNRNSLKIVAEREEVLTATIEPANTTNKTITWTSSDEGIAVVDKNGKVTAKEDGKTTITAKTSNGKEAKCEIRVGLIRGIDVSSWQGSIDWNKVAKSQDFAMIRAGGRGSSSRSIYEDSYFNRNIKEANKAGIKVGVYFYSTAKSIKEAEEEANWVVEKIKGYNISYPVVIDQEDECLSSLSSEQRTDIAIKFLSVIKEKGYIPMYYGYHFLVNMSRINEYDFWLAHWTYSISKPSSYTGKYTIWQYSDSGKVDGIDGNVDLNIAYKDY